MHPLPSSLSTSNVYSIMSKEGETNALCSSPSADESPKRGAKESKSAADVTNVGNNTTTQSVGNESGRQSSSPTVLSPKRLFQTTAKKPNREDNEDTLQSKRSDHPSNTPFEGKQKKKQTNHRTGYKGQQRRDRGQSQKRKIEPKSKAPTSPEPEINESLPPPVALTYNHDTEEGELRMKGYAVPNKKFEQRIRPDTFRGHEVAREEIYDSDDIGRHDQSVFDAAHNIFGHRDVELRSVKEGFLTNNFENLSRLHVEDILTKYDSIKPIHLRVLISKESEKKSWADDSQLIFMEQEDEVLGLGVQQRKIMKVYYYELYATLMPNHNFKSLKENQLQQEEFLRLFLDESDEANNTFELRFEGMPDDARMKFKWNDMVNYPGDLKEGLFLAHISSASSLIEI